jgi:hypothetical protein
MNNGTVRSAAAPNDLTVRGFAGFADNDGPRGYPSRLGWNTAAWRAAWARARAGGGQAHIACFGDSCTEGTNATGWSNRWSEVMQTRVAAVTGVPVGTGIVPLHMWSRGYSTDTRFSGDPAAWKEGNGCGGFLNVATWDYYNATGSLTVSFTPTQPIDSFVVWTAEDLQGAGVGTTDALVDGTPVETGMTAGGVVTLKRREYQVTPGVHTFGWRSNNVSDGVRQPVVGFEGVRNARSGVKVTTAGYYGGLMSGHDDNVGLSGSKAANNWALFRAAKIDLFIWAFGLNEWNNGASPDEFSRKFDEFARYQRTTSWPCSVMLLVQLPPAPSTYQWDTYTSVIRAAAIKHGWGLIDVTARWGARANKSSNYSDTVHGTDAGYAEIGQLAADAVLAPVIDI